MGIFVKTTARHSVSQEIGFGRMVYSTRCAGGRGATDKELCSLTNRPWVSAVWRTDEPHCRNESARWLWGDSSAERAPQRRPHLRATCPGQTPWPENGRFRSEASDRHHDNLAAVKYAMTAATWPACSSWSREAGFYARAQFIGTTGAGKTTVVRQVIGTDPASERFPSISAAKTTICDIEVILRPMPPDDANFLLKRCVLIAEAVQSGGGVLRGWSQSADTSTSE